MATPVIDSFVVSPTSGLVGTPVTATVTFHDPDAATQTITGTVTDAEGNKVAASASFVVSDPCTVVVSDGSARVWTLKSAPGVSPAVFTATI